MIYSKNLFELVDSDGSKIGGMDGGMSPEDEKLTSNSTTDDFVKTSRQGMNRYLYRSFWGEEETDDVEIPDEDKETEEVLESVGKDKMKGMLEDIFTKKSFDTDIVDRIKNREVTLNGIPPLDTIRDTNPILIRKVSALKDIITKNEATGEEKGVILNFLLDMGTNDIPREYKEEIKKKLG